MVLCPAHAKLSLFAIGRTGWVGSDGRIRECSYFREAVGRDCHQAPEVTRGTLRHGRFDTDVTEGTPKGDAAVKTIDGRQTTKGTCERRVCTEEGKMVYARRCARAA